MSFDLYVVVPFYNEARLILDTLNSLARQTDRTFGLVLVDNGSTDDSVIKIEDFRRLHPDMDIQCIFEPKKGTGSASDTGFRHAIQQGADYIARTDADCVVARDWVARIKQVLQFGGLEFIGGKVKPRADDNQLGWAGRRCWSIMRTGLHLIGRIWFWRDGGKVPYFLAAGNNLAITARLYEAVDGFPRIRLERGFEDLILSRRVRRATHRAGYRRDIVVYNSTRRSKTYGHWKTLRWYLGRRYERDPVDIR